MRTCKFQLAHFRVMQGYILCYVLWLRLEAVGYRGKNIKVVEVDVSKRDKGKKKIEIMSGAKRSSAL